MLSKGAVVPCRRTLTSQRKATKKTQIASKLPPSIANVPVQVISAVEAPVDGAIDGNVTCIAFRNVVAGCAGLRYPSNVWKCELFSNGLSSTKHIVLCEE